MPHKCVGTLESLEPQRREVFKTEGEVVSYLRRIVECPHGSESEDDSDKGEMEIETVSIQHSIPRRKRQASAIKVSQPSMF